MFGLSPDEVHRLLARLEGLRRDGVEPPMVTGAPDPSRRGKVDLLAGHGNFAKGFEAGGQAAIRELKGALERAGSASAAGDD